MGSADLALALSRSRLSTIDEWVPGETRRTASRRISPKFNPVVWDHAASMATRSAILNHHLSWQFRWNFWRKKLQHSIFRAGAEITNQN